MSCKFSSLALARSNILQPRLNWNLAHFGSNVFWLSLCGFGPRSNLLEGGDIFHPEAFTCVALWLLACTHAKATLLMLEYSASATAHPSSSSKLLLQIHSWQPLEVVAVSVMLRVTAVIQQLTTHLLQCRENVTTLWTSLSLARKWKVRVHITHANFNFPFKLGPKVACVLYMTAYYTQDFKIHITYTPSFALMLLDGWWKKFDLRVSSLIWGILEKQAG